MKINLKVYINKKNGQARVHLPRKEFEIIPDKITLEVPKEFMKHRKAKW